MKFKAKPAPCLISLESTSIKEIINKMQQHNSSYILIKNKENTLTGIFTSHDILDRFFDLKDKNALEQPISSIGRRTVKTIPAKLIHTAPKIMIQEHIGHLPVVEYDQKTNSTKVIGILTIKSLFECMVKLRLVPDIISGDYEETRKRRTIGIISPDGALYFSFCKLFT